MNHLTPCTSCSRHVRVFESACPFCGAALELSDVPPPVLPTRRITRAALFTFGATLAAGLTVSGCSSDDDGGGKGGGGGADAASGGSGGALYGIPGDSALGGASGAAGSTSSGGQAGAPNTLYGLPPDAG